MLKLVLFFEFYKTTGFITSLIIDFQFYFMQDVSFYFVLIKPS